MLTEGDVTIVVVCFNEEKNIGTCLEALVAQDCVEKPRILVVDGASTDATPGIIKDYCRRYSNIALVNNPKRFISSSRNVGWQQSRTPLIAYTDADCIAPPAWIKRMVATYNKYKGQNSRLGAVGGANIPPADSPFYEALSIFLSSFFGNRGSIQGKALDKYTWINHIPTLNVMYERKVLDEIEGFDEKTFQNIGEDEDLSIRLRASGKKMLYVPGCILVHRQRKGFASWIRNMRTYGYGRVLLMQRHPRNIKPKDFLPLLPLGAIGLGLLGPWQPWAAVPLLAYLLIMAALSIYLCAGQRKYNQVFRVFTIFVLTHISYAIGMILRLYKTSLNLFE